MITKKSAEELIHLLNDYAMSVCSYEYGLPAYNNDHKDMPNHLDNMVDIVQSFIKENNK